MTIRQVLALLGLVPLVVSLQGCPAVLGIGAVGTAMVIAEDRRSSSVQIDDQSIELRAASRISERYGDKAHVNVTSYNHAVLLTGEVPDSDAKAEVERIALAVPNVRRVTNEVVVGAPSSASSRSNDSYITGKVQARFLDAGRFNPIYFKVVTEAGVVYLMGIVTEQEAADAIEIARTTAGVRKVVIIFEYCQPTDEICSPQPKGTGGRAKPKGA
jgi:osmotically-inducible protein OsmY